MVRLGDKGILDLKIGDTGVKRAYLGDVQVWPGYHYFKFWTEAHPVEDMDSWMDGASDSGLYCVTEDVETFMKSLREYPDMTAIYDATGDRTIPVIPTDGGATVSTMASRDGEVGACYINTDLGSVANVHVGSSVVGYAFIAGIAWSDDGTNRQVAWGWLIDADIEGTATFTRGSETHTVTKAGLYLPRATVGFSGSENEFVTREYGVEEYTPIPAETTTLRLHLTSELTQNLYFTQSAANGVTIDWGDGSTAETVSDLSATATHTYAAAGDYTVSMTAGDGVTWWPGTSGFLFGYNILGADMFDAGDASPQLASVHLDDHVSKIIAPSFYGCTLIENITIPESVEEILSLAFSRCTALESAEIFAGRIHESVFSDCTSLHGVWLRDSVETIDVSVSQGARSCTPPWANVASDFTIYCEAESRPSGWSEYFNVFRSASSGTEIIYPVVWGQSTSPF